VLLIIAGAAFGRDGTLSPSEGSSIPSSGSIWIACVVALVLVILSWKLSGLGFIWVELLIFKFSENVADL